MYINFKTTSHDKEKIDLKTSPGEPQPGTHSLCNVNIAEQAE